MVLRLCLVWMAVCTCGAAQTGATVNSLVDSVLGAVRSGQSDGQVAKSLHKFGLAERLDDRTVEELESAGAGPKTLAELARLQSASREMPAPAAPPAAFPMPERPSLADQGAIVAETRENALRYTQLLPDFICTELVKRYEGGESRDSWNLKDTLTVQLSYFQQKENYQLKLVNNRKTSLTYRAVGGALSEGEFGSMMRQIFEPAAAAELRWDHWTTLRRRRAHVFAFEVKTANSQYRIDVKLLDGPLETARLGQRGLIYVDRDTRMVLRIVADAEGIPPQFPVQKATSILDYAFTEIGGREFLLPLHAVARMQTGALDTKNEVEFQSYRKFNGEATITYDGADPVKR